MRFLKLLAIFEAFALLTSIGFTLFFMISGDFEGYQNPFNSWTFLAVIIVFIYCSLIAGLFAILNTLKCKQGTIVLWNLAIIVLLIVNNLSIYIDPHLSFISASTELILNYLPILIGQLVAQAFGYLIARRFHLIS